jgi:molybdopterin-guanine dinucleotide biosynthesis protein A
MAQTGPLPAAFARGALPVLERRLAAGELRLAEALHELEARVVELDEAQLANANTPAELAAIERAAEG